jgi:hypothetical protein
MVRVVLFSLFVGVTFGAIPATAVWELRTGGSVNNAGCYSAAGGGVDYTQQDAAQYTYSDLVLVTTTTVSSASHPFTNADVGNCLRITTSTLGWIPGIYYIQSQSAGIATLDRVAGAMGSTGGTFFVGGAISLPTAMMNFVVNGNTVWFRSGTYTVNAVSNLAAGGGAGKVTISGYGSTRGDNGTATWTTATNNVHLLGITGNTKGVELRQLTMSNSTTGNNKGNCIGFSENTVELFYIHDMIFSGCRSAINQTAASSFARYFIENVEITGSYNSGIIISRQANLWVNNSYIHNNGSAPGGEDGIDVSGNFLHYVVLTNVVLSNNQRHGFTLASNSGLGSFTFQNVVFSGNGSAGLFQSDTVNTSSAWFYNCVFWGNGTYGIQWNGTLPPLMAAQRNNAFGGNGSGAYVNFPAGPGEVTLTANPFVSSSNFSPNETAGGGAALRGMGFPGSTLYGTGYPDIGALQSQAGSSGGGTRVYGSAQ